jgi:hypothetical protein
MLFTDNNGLEIINSWICSGVVIECQASACLVIDSTVVATLLCWRSRKTVLIYSLSHKLKVHVFLKKNFILTYFISVYTICIQ